MANILYTYKNSVYANITNKCNCRCTFCIRFVEEGIGDADTLWHQTNPTLTEVLDAIRNFDFSGYDELVFCGYGEPTYRMDVIEKVSFFAHVNRLKTRINTNGHANLINGKDVTDIIAKCIDTIGISLNEVDEKDYDDICLPVYKNAYEEMLNFAKLCIEKGGNVIFSVVDCIGKAKIEKAKKIAKEIGAKLRVREEIK